MKRKKKTKIAQNREKLLQHEMDENKRYSFSLCERKLLIIRENFYFRTNGVLQRWKNLCENVASKLPTNRKCSIAEAAFKNNNFAGSRVSRRPRKGEPPSPFGEGRASGGRRKSWRVNEFRLVKAKESEERTRTHRLWYLGGQTTRVHRLRGPFHAAAVCRFNCDEFMPPDGFSHSSRYSGSSVKSPRRSIISLHLTKFHCGETVKFIPPPFHVILQIEFISCGWNDTLYHCND